MVGLQTALDLDRYTATLQSWNKRLNGCWQRWIGCKKELKANNQMLAKMNARQGWTIDKMDAWLEEMKAWRKEKTVCQEAPEVCLKSKEPTSVEVESGEMHEEVPKEEAATKTVRAPKERYGDGLLHVGCRRELKKRTQGDGGYRKKLVASCKRVTRLDICKKDPTQHSLLISQLHAVT
jgi:hypothetical protein